MQNEEQKHVENYEDNHFQFVKSIICSPNTDGPKIIKDPFVNLQTNEHSKNKIHVIE